MLPQRARGAESRVKHRSSNGPLRVQSNARHAAQSILQREGIRQLPGVCWYPAECAAGGPDANQGGNADKRSLFVLGRSSFCQGRFFIPFGRSAEGDLFFSGEKRYETPVRTERSKSSRPRPAPKPARGAAMAGLRAQRYGSTDPLL